MRVKSKITIKEKRFISDNMEWCLSVARSKHGYDIYLINYITNLVKNHEYSKLIFVTPILLSEFKEFAFDAKESIAVDKLEFLLKEFTF